MVSFIMANGAGLITGVPGIRNDFTIYGIKQKTKNELYVYIAGPNGGSVPLKFVDTDKNAIKVYYKPSLEGEHKVYIKYGGIPIKGSPFKVNIRGRALFLTLDEKVPNIYDSVFPLDLYSDVISRSVACVSPSGRGLKFGLCGVENEISIDVRRTAPGKLSYSMSGPGNVDLESKEYRDGVHKIMYTPHSTGEYTINLKFAERPIPGSPFTVTVL